MADILCAPLLLLPVGLLVGSGGLYEEAVEGEAVVARAGRQKMPAPMLAAKEALARRGRSTPRALPSQRTAMRSLMGEGARKVDKS